MWNPSVTCLDHLNVTQCCLTLIHIYEPKNLNIDLRKQCEFFGFTENHENESILIFHSCSSNLNVNKNELDGNVDSCVVLPLENRKKTK